MHFNEFFHHYLHHSSTKNYRSVQNNIKCKKKGNIVLMDEMQNEAENNVFNWCLYANLFFLHSYKQFLHFCFTFVSAWILISFALIFLSVVFFCCSILSVTVTNGRRWLNCSFFLTYCSIYTLTYSWMIFIRFFLLSYFFKYKTCQCRSN